MKLFSTNRNSDNKQLICDEAIFDPNLIIDFHGDADENVVTFHYDISECGHPLNLPFSAITANFIVRFTNHNIHISIIVDPCEDIKNCYKEFVGDGGEIEFDARLSADEKVLLLLSTCSRLFSGR